MATDEARGLRLMTSAPSRRAAISNEALVRVEFSKNRFTTVRPVQRLGRALVQLDKAVGQIQQLARGLGDQIGD